MTDYLLPSGRGQGDVTRFLILLELYSWNRWSYRHLKCCVLIDTRRSDSAYVIYVTPKGMYHVTSIFWEIRKWKYLGNGLR